MDEVPAVVVARSEVGQNLEVHREVGDAVQLPAGPLALKFPYRFREAGRQKETWRFRLESSIDGERAPTAVVEWHDRPVLHDEKWGFVRTLHHLVPGEHTLWFRATAEHAGDGWRSGTEAEDGQVDLEGEVTLDVR